MSSQLSLTEKIHKSTATPVQNDYFDIYRELDSVLDDVGISRQELDANISFRGADPVVPSRLRLGAAAAIALVARSAAVAKVWRSRTGESQDISVDLRATPHRLSPFLGRNWESLGGYPINETINPDTAFGWQSFYPTKDDRWVMPLNIYPKLKVATQRLLETPDDPVAVASAISRWQGRDLESAGAESGIVMPMLRETDEFLNEPQYLQFLADSPLIEITKISESPAEPFSSWHADPLGNVRALGMGHVLAGAGIGRSLALHGADVLNLWRPDAYEHDHMYVSANVGVRSSFLQPRHSEGHRRLIDLLADADVFYANRRPGYLDKLGLSAEEASTVRPGLIYATTSLCGQAGPWAHRVGLDQTAGSLVGIMHLEGDDGYPRLPPINIVTDYLAAWLATTGIIEALDRRAREGGSYVVHVSLVRIALWILSMGIFDREYAQETAGVGPEHAFLDPQLFTANTPLGRYQGITDQVRLSATPGRYRSVLVPRGSSAPEWLPQTTLSLRAS